MMMCREFLKLCAEVGAFTFLGVSLSGCTEKSEATGAYAQNQQVSSSTTTGTTSSDASVITL